MRIIGLDFGSKTVGVAMSDELLITAQGVEIVRRKSPLWKSCKIGNEVFFCISCVTQKNTRSTEVTKRSNYSNNEQKSIHST